MIYLLDTHAFIWATLESKKLSKNGKDIIFNKDNEIHVSIVSFWEISIKTRLKKFSFENVDIMSFPQYARDMDFSIMDLKENEAITYHKLPIKKEHKDPFDRMLIWQAITNKITLISKDTEFDQYLEDGLKLIW